MDLTRGALRHPISVTVIVFALVLGSSFALWKMPRDILPNLGTPVIYVAQSFGGLDASQMESYLTYFYEYHFLYISGIEHIESKSIESTALIKLQFHPGTNMAAALAETIAEVDRSRAFMPAGTQPPFVLRFDTGSAPVGKLVFYSDSRTLGELQNYALNFVRPLFATLPGVSATPPFGSSARSILIEVDPKKLTDHDLSADQVVQSLIQANNIVPSGNIHVGSLYPIVPMNAVVSNIKDLLDVPLRLGRDPTTYLRDVATVSDGSDLTTGYALVDGKRTVYIPVTKRADASTLAVVDLVKSNLPRFQNAIPKDIRVTYEFDQSGFVRGAIHSLFFEVILGALLTGLAVLVFLRDFRSVLIVLLNIPLALLTSLLAIWLCDQTINVMTLGGLALAVGILVDETTVTIENIHTHLQRGASKGMAALQATREVFRPALLTLLCILSVFIPSFFMTGVGKALFIPLTLSVGFSMIGSFLLSRTLVPVLAAKFLKTHLASHCSEEDFEARYPLYKSLISKLMVWRRPLVLSYLGLAFLVIFFVISRIGLEIFPQSEASQFQMRIRAVTGTSIESTEKITLQIIDLIRKEVGSENLRSSLAFVGTQPPSYAVNTIHLWTSGPHEAVLEVALRKDFKSGLEDLKEKLRADVVRDLPGVLISFEPSTLVERGMSEGTNTPIEIRVTGSDVFADRAFAEKIRDSLQELPFIRDLQFGQKMHYPTLPIDIDRRAAGLRGLTVAQIGQAVVPATSSSRYLTQNYWPDPRNGINYQVQVEVPQKMMGSAIDIENIPIPGSNGDSMPLRHYAKVGKSTQISEYDRYNMQRLITITANLHDFDLGHASQLIQEKISKLESQRPRGIEVKRSGQMNSLEEMEGGLKFGLLLAIVIVFLLLAANFESFRLSFSILSIVPAVLAGSLILLLLTKTSLNVESFMGMIMAIGVAVANAILMITFAERARILSGDSVAAVISQAKNRLRPILMTSSAMLVGMIPMSIGAGEGGGLTAPLGRAVIGGLLGSTLAILFILPLVYAWIQDGQETLSASLDPEDSTSKLFES